MRVRASIGVAGLLLGSLAVVGATGVVPAHALGERHVDFNGDGYDDLVVPANGESVGPIEHAGAVTIMYGSASGITGTGSVTITEDTPGVPDTAEPRDNFGYTHAEGDFNGDGYTDVAVSSSETIGSTVRAGAVTVLWGSAQGVTTTGSVEYTGDSVGVPAAQTAYSYFGTGLAAGDFNGDGHIDLAISAPGATVGSVEDAGLVTLLDGGPTGLTPTGQVVHQGMAGIAGAPEAGDEFASTMAAGDIDGNGTTDLVLGTPEESAGTTQHTGEVDIVYGQATGLLPVHSLTYNGPSQYHDFFGAEVGVDNALSPPNVFAYAAHSSFAGQIYRIVPHVSVYPLFRGSGTHQYDQCGLSLAFGNFGGDNFGGKTGDAIAFGCPGWVNFKGGMVTLRRSGFSTTNVQQAINVPGAQQHDGDFGWTLEARDLNGDGWDDLVIGVPFYDVGSVVDAGEFYVVYGGSNGLDLAHAHIITQETQGVPGASEPNDIFGYV